MLRLYCTVCACSATICACNSTSGVLRLFTHLGIIILRLFLVSWIGNSCVHSLVKTIQDLKQNTISASREARLCHVSEMPESCNLSPETKLSTRVSKYEIRNVNN